MKPLRFPSLVLSISATRAVGLCWLLAITAVSAGGTPVSASEQARELPAVGIQQLPPQAHETLDLIDKGGAFPYPKDGSVFFNRERLLPRAPQGYYREFTVRTPGSRDRGARRIVRGGRGELYYTEDHYRTFKRVIR